MSFPSFEYEKHMQREYGPFIAGVDEVGRGPLCGPVVTTAALILDEVAFTKDFADVNDSKKLTSSKREAVFERLVASPLIVFAEGRASVEEIDQLNIRQATLLAMRRAIRSIKKKHEISAHLVDGNVDPYALDLFEKAVFDKEDRDELVAVSSGQVHRPVGQFLVKGDAKSLSIATASILAKVTRDRLMKELSKEHPEYGWERNAGYGTAEHLAALREWGPTPHHRRSFAPVRRAGEVNK